MQEQQKYIKKNNYTAFDERQKTDDVFFLFMYF